MKEYTLAPAVRGLKVFSDDESYFVALKMFSLSARTLDADGCQVASMKRISWWTLKYRIEAGDEVYSFASSALTGTLIATTSGERFVTNGTVDLYGANGKRVTELSRNKSPLGSLSLRIHSDRHIHAFILVSCLFYKTVINAPGYAV